MENDEYTPELEQDENQNEEAVEYTEDVQDEDQEEQIDWKARALKSEAILARNRDKNREKPQAQKAQPKDDGNLNSKDLFALMKANVSEDDIDDVVDYAKFKNISVSEALKSSAVKAIIAEKTEFKKTAEVSNTSNARRGSSKVSDDVLLSNLSKGNIPEKGSEEAERIFWARRGGKR